MTRRPCWVEISTGAIEDNFRVLAEASAPVELLAIVKADAYGHSVELCAPAAVRAGAKWLGVTSVEEGLAARAACGVGGGAAYETAFGIGPEILVIGGVFRGQGETAARAGLTAVVWEPWQIAELAAGARAAGVDGVPVHLELDTGMSRQGVGAGGLDEVLAALKAAPELRLGGLMTHLYAADESDGAATREQFGVLEELVARVVGGGRGLGSGPEWLHVGNSAAVLGGEALRELPAVCGRWGMKAMARPGLALYGLTPEFVPEEPEGLAALRGRLRRVLEWKTQVVSVRSVDAGRVVGYNATFVATEPMRLALLAVGYGDGLRRGLSNCGAVLVRGQRAPIVGRISMDQTVVDVTEIAGVQAGDEVVLLGRQGDEAITAEDHAGWAGTIPWEIFTGIGGRVERVGNREE